MGRCKLNMSRWRYMKDATDYGLGPQTMEYFELWHVTWDMDTKGFDRGEWWSVFIFNPEKMGFWNRKGPWLNWHKFLFQVNRLLTFQPRKSIIIFPKVPFLFYDSRSLLEWSATHGWDVSSFSNRCKVEAHGRNRTLNRREKIVQNRTYTLDP